MFFLLFKRLSQKKTITLELPTNIYNLCYLQIQKSHNFSSISQNQLSPTVSYLTNKCGVPLDSAIKASQKIQIDSTEKPDAVLQILKNYDFTEPQIVNLILKLPSVLQFDPVRTLQPKLDCFESLGWSKREIATRVSSYACILSRSATNQILSTYTFLKRFLKNDKDIGTALLQIHSGFIVCKTFHLEVESNIEVLRNHGVPDSNIGKLLMTKPRAFTLKKDMLEEIVGLIKGMGLDLHSYTFVHAIGIMGSIGKSGWEYKVEVYKRFGWSEEDVIEAFKLHPPCMATSEKKIGKMMDFYLNKLGLTTSDVGEYPILMNVSLENVIIPRCSVLQVLASNGLIGKGEKLTVALKVAKKHFDKKFVEKYKGKIPDVLKAYKGKLGYPKLDVLLGIL